ncbi:Protein TOC75-4 [Forsythia ovata]|uniref:Protein TOC75-4 n=1 Tax=Forsythia ovata TaxID=205694 RepID=A0ABD1P3K0_9LAMI
MKAKRSSSSAVHVEEALENQIPSRISPNSIQSFNIAKSTNSSSRITHLAAEVRIPVKNTFVYAFAEHGNDLGSSVSVQRKPTKAYMRNGHGSSYGVGVKLGQVRAEYAIDHNSRRGTFFVHCGERF